MSESAYTDCKEKIAALIFDFDYVEPDERPHEDTAHAIAEDVIAWLDPELLREARKEACIDKVELCALSQ